MKTYSPSCTRSARIGGALLSATGIYAILFLLLTENNLAWIFPTGIVAAGMLYLGFYLIAKVRPNRNSGSGNSKAGKPADTDEP